MKNVFLATLAIMTFSFANAQTARFGVKGGLNISTLNGDVGSADPKIGAHIGGFVEIKATNRFSIQPELLLSLQGATYDRYDFGDDYSYENKENLTYLNIPVMAKFYVIPNLSIEAGPQIGFLVSAKNRATLRVDDGDGFFYNETRTYDVKGDRKSVDAAFNIGASYFFTDNMFVQARFSLGLTTIEDANRRNSVAYDIYNNVFQASFGYRF